MVIQKNIHMTKSTTNKKKEKKRKKRTYSIVKALKAKKLYWCLTTNNINGSLKSTDQ